MKKKSIVISSFFVMVFYFTFYLKVIAFSFETMPAGGSFQTIYNIIITIGQWLFGFLVAGGLIGVIIGSVNLLFSQGDSGKITTGKKMIIYSLIAVFVGSFAWTIVNWARYLFFFPG